MAGMTIARSPFSPALKARIAGGLWVLVIVCGVFAEMIVRSSMIVRGDAAATAANILASEPLYRLAFVADLAGAGAYVAVSFLLYDLLKPVNKNVSLFAMLLGLAGSAIMAANLANLMDALSYLKVDYLAPLGLAQRQALAMLALRFHGLGYNIAMTVFAGHVLLLGCLILRSPFLPRLLGLLFLIEGVCGWLRILGLFLLPDFSDSLNSGLLMPSLVAEGGAALWLLAMGVDVPRWRAQAEAGGG